MTSLWEAVRSSPQRLFRQEKKMEYIFKCFTEAQILNLANQELQSAGKKVELTKADYFLCDFQHVLVCQDKHRNHYTVHLDSPKSHLMGIKAINKVKRKFSKYTWMITGEPGRNLTGLLFNGSSDGINSNCKHIKANMEDYKSFLSEILSQSHDGFVVGAMVDEKLTNAGYGGVYER